MHCQAPILGMAASRACTEPRRPLLYRCHADPGQCFLACVCVSSISASGPDHRPRQAGLIAPVINPAAHWGGRRAAVSFHVRLWTNLHVPLKLTLTVRAGAKDITERMSKGLAAAPANGRVSVTVEAADVRSLERTNPATPRRRGSAPNSLPVLTRRKSQIPPLVAQFAHEENLPSGTH